MRAEARREKFLHSLRKEKKVDGDSFDSVRALFSSGEPLVWKRKQAFMGSILVIRANGDLTNEGRFLESQGWTRPRTGKLTSEERLEREINGS